MAIKFDNHQFAKRLLAAGMSSELADIQVEITGELVNELVTFNTKLDNFIANSDTRFGHTDDKIDKVEIKLNARIDQVEARLEAKIADTKAELIRWVVGVGVLQTSFIAALLLKLML